MKKLTIIGEQEELRCEDTDDLQERQLLDFQKEIADLKQIQSPQKDKWQEIKKQKKQKAKQIKKILKERLNIDCLRMLCEDSPDEGDGGQKSHDQGLTAATKGQLSRDNLENTSMHVLMREIGIEQNDGLSQAFLDKNGEAKREQLNSFTEMFSVRDLLGVGAFGVVLLVKNRFTKERSALKIIAKEKLSERAQKILKNESTIMRTMDHPAVVSLKRIFENQKFIILEMELVPGGQLKRLFKLKDKSGTPKPLSDLEASRVMKNLLEGVNYVHARDIIHRDLKPENILLTSLSDACNDVKIVDFGLSAEQNWRNRQNVRAGTPIYMAPEQVMNGKGYSQKIDLWACGIISYQLLACGQHPCYTPGEINYCKKLQEIETQPIEWTFPSNFTPLAKDFFLRLCSYPHSERYDAATALKHPWITRGDSNDIPLNKLQEFAMFEQEVKIRKVMRLLYFASTVKMAQIQTGEDLQDNSECESLPQTPPTQPVTQNRLKSAARRLYQKQLQPNNEKRPSSQEREKEEPPQKKLYSHNAFLTNSFKAYKQKILALSDKKQSIDSSTSAESTNKRTPTSIDNPTSTTQPKQQQYQHPSSLIITKKQSSFNLKSPLKRSPTKSKKHSSKKAAGLTTNNFNILNGNNQESSLIANQLSTNGTKIDAFLATSSQLIMLKGSSSNGGGQSKPRANTFNQQNPSLTKNEMYLTQGNYQKARVGRNGLAACSPQLTAATTANKISSEDLKAYSQLKEQDSFSRRAQFVQQHFGSKMMTQQQNNRLDSRMLALTQENEDDSLESSLMHTKTIDFAPANPTGSQFTNDLYPQGGNKAEISQGGHGGDHSKVLTSTAGDTTLTKSMSVSRKGRKAQVNSTKLTAGGGGTPLLGFQDGGGAAAIDTIGVMSHFKGAGITAMSEHHHHQQQQYQQQPHSGTVISGKKLTKKRAVSKKSTTTPLANRIMMESPQGQIKMKAQHSIPVHQQKMQQQYAISGVQGKSVVDWMNLDNLVNQQQHQQSSEAKLKGLPQSAHSWQRYMYLDKLIKAEKSQIGAQKMIKLQQALPVFEERSNALRTSRPRSILCAHDYSEKKQNSSLIYQGSSAQKSAHHHNNQPQQQQQVVDQSQSLSHDKQLVRRDRHLASPLLNPKKPLLVSAYTNSSMADGNSLHLQQHHINANSSPGFPSPDARKRKPLKSSKTSAKKVDTAQVFKMTDLRCCLSSKSIERLWQQHGERALNETPYKQVSMKSKAESNYPFERSNTEAVAAISMIGPHDVSPNVEMRRLSHLREGNSEVKIGSTSWVGSGLTSAAMLGSGGVTQTDRQQQQQNQTNFPDVLLNKVIPLDHHNEPLRLHRQRNSCEAVQFHR